jgi:hypothetical protein
MKNLINFLSNNSQFFNEKRFIYEGGFPESIPKRGLEISGREKETKGSLKPMEMARGYQAKSIKRLRERFLNNPDSFKAYGRLSRKVTENLAELGVPKPKLKSSIDKSDGLGTRMVDQQEYARKRQKAIDDIARAFNKNDRTRTFFFKALVDLYIYKKFVDDKAKRIQTYRKIARELKRISPRTYAQLSNLKNNLLAKKVAVAGGRQRRSSKRRR